MEKSLFWYQREVLGDDIVDVEGKRVGRKDSIFVWDCFNVNCIVRGFWSGSEIFSILLNDGHEESRVTEPGKILKNGQQIEPKKERAWYYSQVNLNIKDFERFRVVTERLVGREDIGHPQLGKVFDDGMPTD